MNNIIIDKKYIIFDMDGVILDSMQGWYKCAYRMLNMLQNNNATLTNTHKKEIWDNYNNMDKLNQKDFLDKWYKEMDKEYEIIKIKDYVLDFIKQAKDNNIHLAIATSTPISMVNKVLDRLDLIKYFDYIEDEEESKEPKYTGKIFDDIVKKWNINCSDCIIFEDSINNVKIPKQKGYKIIGVYDELSSYTKEAYISLADYYIYSFKELL